MKERIGDGIVYKRRYSRQKDNIPKQCIDVVDSLTLQRKMIMTKFRKRVKKIQVG